MHEVTLQSLQQLWCCYMLVARSKSCMKWGNLRGASLDCLEKAMCGAVLFSFPAAWLILYKCFMSKWKLFSFRPGNGFIWKKYMEGRGASVFPWFLAGAQTLSGALSTSSCLVAVGLAWTGWIVEIQMWEQTAWLAAIVGVRCFVAVF